MKKCNSCQTIQNDANKFCSQCGSTNFSSVGGQESSVNRNIDEKRTLQRVPNRKIYVLAVLIVIAVIFTVVATTFLFNPLTQIMRDIKADNFSDATDIYQKKIVSDNDKYQKTYNKVAAYVEDLLEQYKNKEISYDYLMNKLDGIDSISILGREIIYAYTEAEHLQFCRETYYSAETQFSNGNYKEAINLYAQIADADFENGKAAIDKYNQSVELFRDKIVNSVQEYINSSEYSMAMTLLEDALCVIPGDSELLSVQQSCMQAEYDNNIQSMLEETRVYTEKKDYVGALNFLNSCISTYPEELLLEQEKNNCLTEFESYIVAESLKLAKEGEFQHALSLTQSGLNYFNSSRVTELNTVYKSYIPVTLGEMEMFQNNTEGGSWVTKTNETDKYLVDNYGNVYENSLSVGHGSVAYLINFNYQTFRGTVAFPKGLESDSARKSATLRVYGDGEKIAEFINVNESTKPESFALNISSYEKITLEWKCEGMNIWSDWGYFATIFEGRLYRFRSNFQKVFNFGIENIAKCLIIYKGI